MPHRIVSMVGGSWLVVGGSGAARPHEPPTTNHQPKHRPVQILRPLRAHAVLDANTALFRIACLADDADATVARNERVDEIHAGTRLVIVLKMQVAAQTHPRSDVAARTKLNRANSVTHLIQ